MESKIETKIMKGTLTGFRALLLIISVGYLAILFAYNFEGVWAPAAKVAGSIIQLAWQDVLDYIARAKEAGLL